MAQELDIAVGYKYNTKRWRNRKITWDKLVEKLKNPKITDETLKEYQKLSKEDKHAVKDVGGYFGGYLRGGRRKPENIVHRQLVTLDIDFGHLDLWDDFTLMSDAAALIHITHSHTDDKPRYRLILPLAREVAADEYIPIARYIADLIDIELFDDTTFDTNRFMFWPSVSKDVEYYVQVQDGPWVDPDEVLGTYVDWTDSSAWPVSSRATDRVKNAAEKQQNPTEKEGIIGYFCQTYSIKEAIETFLQDEYEAFDETRYTYKAGSTVAGLVLYDQMFAFSHHGTDPVSGKLVNAFDIVRIHKYGHLDTSTGQKASMDAMTRLAQNDERVKSVIARSKLESARLDFAHELPDDIDEIDIEWAKQLDVNKRGDYESSSSNLNLILQNDTVLKEAFKYNLFDGKSYVFRSLPWRKIREPEPIRNVDLAGIRNYIDCAYQIGSANKVNDAITIEIERLSYHPVRDYLDSLEWDGEDRVERLLIDYFGAEDSEYTRQVIRKVMAGAVARIYRPGCKFDLVLVLVGEQGEGKSTLVQKLGRGFSSDTFTTVHGKESFEQLQGAWLIEIAELAGIRKAEVEAIKHFISKQKDDFRPAYGRTIESYPRQCIFIGTTNNASFLRDTTGNRRFLPVDVYNARARKSIFTIEPETVDQLWAEAKAMYAAGEKLYLTGEAEKAAKKQQHDHTALDEREGIINDFLDTPLPESWETLDLSSRRMYLLGETDLESSTDMFERQYVCTAEIWCECLGKEKNDMDRWKTRELNEIMRNLPGWRQAQGNKRFKLYGTQKYFERVGEELGEKAQGEG